MTGIRHNSDLGILSELSIPMIQWGTPLDHDNFKITNAYCIFSSTSVVDDNRRLQPTKLRTIFSELSEYLKSLKINYGILMRIDYSMLYTDRSLETDPLYFKLSSGWNIIDPLSENTTPELQHLADSVKVDIIVINDYLDDIRI